MHFWKSYICSDKLDMQEQTYLWYLIVIVLGNTTQNHDRTVRPVVSSSEMCSPPHTIHKRMESRRVINDLDNVDLILKRRIFSSRSKNWTT